MLSDQRQYEITEIIYREGKASIAELAQRFGVSAETIRRDLNIIIKDQKIRKVHGGAVAIRRPVRDESYIIRQSHHAINKKRIGEYAVRFLSDGDIIGIDSGTCAESFAKAICHVRDLTVITHSMPVAAILAKKISEGDFTGTVHLLGGTVLPETGTVHGVTTLSHLQKYRMDKAFLAATALSESGVMAGLEQDGTMSAVFARQAEASYVLAESDKLDKHSFFHAVSWDEVTALITDDETEISEPLRKSLSQSGAELHIVPLSPTAKKEPFPTND